MDYMCTSLLIPTTSSEPFLYTKELCTAKHMTMKKLLYEIMVAPLSEPCLIRRMKMFSRLNGSMFYNKLRIDFCSNSELLYPIMKVRFRLIRTRPKLYTIGDNPNLIFRIDNCAL